MATDPLHIRLLNILAAIRDLSPFDMMTAEEDELLRELIVRWHHGKSVSVSEVMKDMRDVSPTTAYRRLIALRDKGLIQLKTDKNDKRVRLVCPTELSKKYINQVNSAIEKFFQTSRTI